MDTFGVVRRVSFLDVARAVASDRKLCRALRPFSTVFGTIEPPHVLMVVIDSFFGALSGRVPACFEYRAQLLEIINGVPEGTTFPGQGTSALLMLTNRRQVQSRPKVRRPKKKPLTKQIPYDASFSCFDFFFVSSYNTTNWFCRFVIVSALARFAGESVTYVRSNQGPSFSVRSGSVNVRPPRPKWNSATDGLWLLNYAINPGRAP